MARKDWESRHFPRRVREKKIHWTGRSGKGHQIPIEVDKYMADF